MVKAKKAKAKPAKAKRSTSAIERAVHADRIKSFMVFVRAMPKTYKGQVFGTADQARSIAAELERLGH